MVSGRGRPSKTWEGSWSWRIWLGSLGKDTVQEGGLDIPIDAKPCPGLFSHIISCWAEDPTLMFWCSDCESKHTRISTRQIWKIVKSFQLYPWDVFNSVRNKLGLCEARRFKNSIWSFVFIASRTLKMHKTVRKAAEQVAFIPSSLKEC